MDDFWAEIARELPTTYEVLSVSFKLVLAALLAAVPGLQRERQGQAAGLRTHMMVSVGAAVFVMAALEAGATIGETTRVIQGLATGIGFVGAGAILKSKEEMQVHGLTTAASVWLTAGIGTAVGLGRIWLPVLGTILALVILDAVEMLVNRLKPPKQPRLP